MEEEASVEEQKESSESVSKAANDLDALSAQRLEALHSNLREKIEKKTRGLQTQAEVDYATKQILKAELADLELWNTVYRKYSTSINEMLRGYRRESEYGLPVSIEHDPLCRKALIENTSFAVVYRAMFDDIRNKPETIEIVKKEKQKKNRKDVEKWFHKRADGKSRYLAVVTPDRKKIATRNNITERTVKSTIIRMTEEGYLVRIGKTEPRGPTYYAMGYWGAWGKSDTMGKGKIDWKPKIASFIKAKDIDRLRGWKLKGSK